MLTASAQTEPKISRFIIILNIDYWFDTIYFELLVLFTVDIYILHLMIIEGLQLKMAIKLFKIEFIVFTYSRITRDTLAPLLASRR